MKIRVTGKKLIVTDGIRTHLEEKLNRYDKFASRLVESHVILKKEKYYYETEITLLARHLKAFGEGKSKENIFKAIDQAAERVEKQLLKYREKLKDHRIPGAAKSAAGGARSRKVSVAELLGRGEEEDETPQ